MKLLLVTALIVVSAPWASATMCSESPANSPCTPDDTPENDQIKSDIRRLVRLAERTEPDIKNLEAQYLALRQQQSDANLEQRYAVLDAYRSKRIAQEELYRQALDKTADLYHVRPNNTGTVTIARSTDPKLEWMSGLSAHWRPEATESGSGVKLAFKIRGSDVEDHYGGLASMETAPLDPTAAPRYAITFPDGRSFILKGTFSLALDEEKHGLGFLASVLFHETRHFDYLSRPCRKGQATCGWSSETRDERDAYAEQNRLARVFGLKPDDRDAFIANWRAFDAEVKAGHLKSFNPEPADAKKWATYYEHEQINLEDEYADLKNKVETARKEQLDREAREAEERRRRQEEIDRMTAKAEMLAEVRNQIDKCGVGPLYGSDGRTFIGFRVTVNGWPASYAIAHDMTIEELKTALMFARACLDVTMLGVDPAEVRPCNDGADIAAQHWTDAAFRSDAQFRVAPEQQVRCLRYVYDHWTTPMTAKRTARILSGARAEYRKAVDENWRRQEKEREDAEESERERRTPRERPERPEPEERHSPTPHFHCGFNSGGAYCE